MLIYYFSSTAEAKFCKYNFSLLNCSSMGKVKFKVGYRQQKDWWRTTVCSYKLLIFTTFFTTHSATRSPAVWKNRIEHSLILLNSNHRPHGEIKKTFQISIIIFMGHCIEEPKLDIFSWRKGGCRKAAGSIIPSIGDSLFKETFFLKWKRRFIVLLLKSM